MQPRFRHGVILFPRAGNYEVNWATAKPRHPDYANTTQVSF
jgi:hypothetical protein